MSEKTEYTFWELIEKFKIEIPIIQRDYAQGRKTEEVYEIREGFLNSLFKAINENKQIDLDFIYGNIMSENTTDIKTFTPLDGQQRLTTLFLLHWYLATKDGVLDKCHKTLGRFTYETRASSREFCIALTNAVDLMDDFDYSSATVSELIVDSNWFFLSWKRDPTINAMLVMLDHIHQKFRDTYNFFEKLIADRFIVFQFVKLENFGLDDELYIKMNARGKPLTDFENFKAKIEQLLAGMVQKGQLPDGFDKRFAINMDSTWTDIFWCYKAAKTYLYDDKVMNFFNRCITNYYASQEKYNRKTLADLLGKQKLSFIYCIENNCLGSDLFVQIYVTLNALYNGAEGIKEYKTYKCLVDEADVFNKVINPGIDYTDRIRFYAICQFFKEHDGNLDSQKFTDWIRFIGNLTENTYYNSQEEYARAIGSIADIVKESKDILSYLAVNNNRLVGFLAEQVSEERIKAVLILKNARWKDAIINAENHPYYRGQIGFVLRFSGIEDEYYKNNTLLWSDDEDEKFLNAFNNYYEKSNCIFDSYFISTSGNLLRRALLCKGDYLIKQSQNLSFLIYSHRDISFRALLNDGKKSMYVKELLDDIGNKPENTVDDLERVILSSKVTDWRKYFIRNKNVISACGSNYYIRKYDDNDILLLNSSMTSGYTREYRTYALYCQLKEEKCNVRYVELQGAYSEKYIEIPEHDIGVYFGYYDDIEKWKYCIYRQDDINILLDSEYEVVDCLRNKIKKLP